MSDRKVKRLTPNSIANLVMADEAWHDSLYVRAEDYDSLLADFEALRAALAAPRPEPSGYAYRYADGVLRFNGGSTINGAPPIEVLPYWFAPPATHPGYVIGSHWLETAYSRICAGEAEADVLRDCGWERVTDAEALRREETGP